MTTSPLLHELCTDDFDFALPPEAIAQSPQEPRDHARLLHVTLNALEDQHVYDLPKLLRSDDLLILNNTKVIPARLYGQRGSVHVEVLLHRHELSQTWLAFARPGKRLKVGDILVFAGTFSAEILSKHEDGEIRLHFSVSDAELPRLLAQYGEPPLPPYIHRQRGEAKNEATRYQTVYADHDGSVAAPTAGLHFTHQLLTALAEKGIQHRFVTLHVGAGTFLPVKTNLLKEHKMHAEWAEIDEHTADAINRAKKEGRRIVAVGTTSLRLLESATDEKGFIHPFKGDTRIFIYPGYSFRMVDALITNFHLPKSTLFMLVSAFAGLEKMRQAYEYAIAKNYRFYSYGDATLLEKHEYV